ncbi:amino-terminal region of chorein, A TM vesicle-mediated sorter [Senna tora]|uniref:Amino-terminal region of chorein, A TM vesicle-mediated sorter n=1 Tax=Senna tora TaxID=362788 RepID=A0A834WXR4_9FABA|nr:amino-terminal region of chorein, A TM vesicle-mediated sorter [Senna tora]
MESILGKALEYTLKYWLKSFSRDQFKLQGRTVQLSNLDLNGDAVHSSFGLPPALNVATAKVRKLEIMLPSVSNVQTEPITVQVDRLDLVLEENIYFDASASPKCTTPSTASTKGSGYGFADKIADGMTINIHIVNLLLETRGSACGQEGATWAQPMASITIFNLSLYTTNEEWQVVNLKDARDFSTNKKYIYVFKKLEWESLSIDLLPHPDMFTGSTLGRSQEGANQRDDDGAKRVFFGGERFIEGISGEAYITIQRTELNSPLGLEVQLHVTEAICPALSEPGLRALLRFMTGLYVCLNRGDIDVNTQKRSTEAAGRSLVSAVVDHIYLCIKDTEFKIELLMQSLFFSRDPKKTQPLDSRPTAWLELRPLRVVTISSALLTGALVVESSLEMERIWCSKCNSGGDGLFNRGEQGSLNKLVLLKPDLKIGCSRIKPSPFPPSFASQTVIDCQPLMIHLQEESCLRIFSFLADGIVVNPGDVLPNFSVNSFMFTLKGLDLTIPLDKAKMDMPESKMDYTVQSSFSGARLHIESLFFSDSPSLKLRMLNLEKDPSCFILWEDHPIDASLKKWTARASHISLSLETCTGTTRCHTSLGWREGLWRCIELKHACVEVAMATADGSPLLEVPPPGGIMRVGVACEQFLSNTSVEQFFFVLDLYAYFGKVGEKIAIAGKSKRLKYLRETSSRKWMNRIPSNTAMSLALKDLQLRFVESSLMNGEEMPLVQFIGDDLSICATHKTLGGAIVVSSKLQWESVKIDCVDAEGHLARDNCSFFNSAENIPLISGNGFPQLRAVFWVYDKKNNLSNGDAHSFPFLNISMEHVVPLYEEDLESHSLNVSASISGVRLGGGMNYAEALLHRFGILGPDGGPGKGLCKGLENLQSGPLSKLFKTAPLIVDESMIEGKESNFLCLKKPDNVDVTVELRDWLFALEGAQEMAERWWFSSCEDVGRVERCWHSTFQNLRVTAKSNPKDISNGKTQLRGMQQFPVQLIMVGVQGLEIFKPHILKDIPSSTLFANGVEESTDTVRGAGLEVRLVLCEDNIDDEIPNWKVENLKFCFKHPVEVVVTKDECQHLAFVCKSEIDSMGRMTAGVLRLLKLEGSVGQSAIDQLSNLGSEGIDNIFSPEKHSRNRNVGPSPLSNPINESQHRSMESAISLLEEAVVDSQAKLKSITQVGTSDSSIQHLATVNEVLRRIETMENLLTQLRDQL